MSRGQACGRAAMEGGGITGPGWRTEQEWRCGEDWRGLGLQGEHLGEVQGGRTTMNINLQGEVQRRTMDTEEQEEEDGGGVTVQAEVRVMESEELGR